MKKNITLNIIILISSVIISIILAELLLHLFYPSENVTKNILESRYYFASCYTTDPYDYFPITLEHDDDKRRFQQQLEISDKKLELLSRETPHCISYDLIKRVFGYFPDRNKSYVLIGDSFTFGEGVNDNDTLSYILGTLYKDYNFLNYGEPGIYVNDVYNQIQYIENASGVIYFYNINDALVNEDLYNKQMQINDLVNIKLQNVKNRSSFLYILSRKIQIINLVIKTILLEEETEQTVKYYNDIYFSKDNKEYIDDTFTFIQAMKSELDKREIPFQLVIYPLIFKDDDGNYPFTKIHNYILERCQVTGISCIDGYPAFSNMSSMQQFAVHPIDLHPNGKANRKIIGYLDSTDTFILENNIE